MKKLLIFLLLPLFALAQTETGQEQEMPYNILIPVSVLQTPSTTTWIGTFGSTGVPGKVAPQNISIPQVPLNYAVSTPTIGGHLNGIDTKLGSIVATTAGQTTRVWFTADGTTVGGNPYYQTGTTKGTAAIASQSVVNDDNQKKYFTQDVIGAPFVSPAMFPPGVYAGNLSASTTPNSAQQRWTVELYKCDNSGTPIASGVTGAAVGSLGVTVITILDSGLLTLADGSVTNVQVSGNLGGTGFSINAGERVRYHVSAEKVGTAASNITQSVYYGTSYNSFIDVTVPLNTNSVVNLSTVAGSTTTEALNNLKASIPAVYSTVVYVNTTDPNTATIFDDVNPPVTNDNALKADVNNLYVGTNSSGWVYNATTLSYQTKVELDIYVDNITLTSNPVGDTSHKIRQLMATDDFWQIYGDATVVDKGIMVFEVGDGGSPYDSGGQKFEFRYNADAFGTAKTPLTIDYDRILFNTSRFGIGTTNPQGIFHAVTTTEVTPFIFENTGGAGIGTGSIIIKNQIDTYNLLVHSSNNAGTPVNWYTGIGATADKWGVYRNDISAPILSIDNTGKSTFTGYTSAPLKVRKISTNTTLADSDNGTVILLTASCTVTLPNGLMSGFNVSFSTATGATLTYALGGSIVLINNAGTTMAQNLSHTIVNTGTSNEYLCAGSL